jgi:SAM-dependent methyltransferase
MKQNYSLSISDVLSRISAAENVRIFLSNPVKGTKLSSPESVQNREIIRVRIMGKKNSPDGSATQTTYHGSFFTATQAFHQTFNELTLAKWLESHAGRYFRQTVIETDTDIFTILSGRKGTVRILHDKQEITENLSGTTDPAVLPASDNPHNRQKQYRILPGKPVPFLVHLGVMTAEGKVVAAKYDKFKQINRFLEYIDDILPRVLEHTAGRQLRIADFGCGKSYLTFAVHYYLTQIKGLSVDIIGLDLREDVISLCSKLASTLECSGLSFHTGDISDYAKTAAARTLSDSVDAIPGPDIVMTLHACDTATDHALAYAVSAGAVAILSVPCCQHELNAKIGTTTVIPQLVPLMKYGIVKERFSALATDTLRAELLEQAGYSVQILEFIDMSHTPKNLMIRAVRIPGKKPDFAFGNPLATALGAIPLLDSLLSKNSAVN